jgi:hypothetical protein
MTTCVILHNMIIDDEKGSNLVLFWQCRYSGEANKKIGQYPSSSWDILQHWECRVTQAASTWSRSTPLAQAWQSIVWHFYSLMCDLNHYLWSKLFVSLFGFELLLWLIRILVVLCEVYNYQILFSIAIMFAFLQKYVTHMVKQRKTLLCRSVCRFRQAA